MKFSETNPISTLIYYPQMLILSLNHTTTTSDNSMDYLGISRNVDTSVRVVLQVDKT